MDDCPKVLVTLLLSLRRESNPMPETVILQHEFVVGDKVIQMNQLDATMIY